MSYQTDIPPSLAPTYFIYRDGESNDATAPPVFYPPKDSDELFDALRAKYPHVKSHSDRMRDAIIEFLLEERDAESYTTTSPTVPSLYDSSLAASPWQQSWPSMSSTCQNSPETANLVTPTFGTSPNSQTPQVARQASTVAASSTASPPALDQMTSVFSLSTSEQPKQRVRRKMTEAEKVEYRKRRIVKACDKCAKRKRKCNHNTPDDSPNTTTNANPVQKVKKPRMSKKAVDRAWPFTPSAAIAADEDFSALKHHDPLSQPQAASFEDFTTLLDDPVPEINFDDLVDFNQAYDLANSAGSGVVDPALAQWPWSDGQDWTLLDPSHGTGFAAEEFGGEMVGDLNGVAYANSDGPQVFHEPRVTAGRPQLSTDNDRILTDRYTLASSNHEHILPSRQGMNSRSEMSDVDSRGSSPGSSAQSLGSWDSGSGTQGREVFQSPSSSTGTDSGNSSASGTGNGMLWEHLRTGQSQVQAQASQQPHPASESHNLTSATDRRVSSGVVETGQEGLSGETLLAGTVLQVQGTARAARAATGLLSARSSRDVSVAGLENASLRVAGDQPHRLLETEGALLARPVISSGAGIEWRAQTTQASAASPQGLAPPQQPSVALPSTSSSTLQDLTGHDVPRLATTSAFSTERSPFDNNECFNQANTAIARGSSTELLRLKRRIPKALHSILDRDAAADTPRIDARASALSAAAARASMEGGATRTAAVPAAKNTAATTVTPATAAANATVAAALVNANKDATQPAAVFAETPAVARLRDTNRHRDHHGRFSFTTAKSATAASFWGAMALLCATLLCTASVGSGQWSGSMVLALCCVFATGCAPEFASGTNGGELVGAVAVRCSGKNSSWLFRMARLAETLEGGKGWMGKTRTRASMGAWGNVRAAGCSGLAVV